MNGPEKLLKESLFADLVCYLLGCPKMCISTHIKRLPVPIYLRVYNDDSTLIQGMRIIEFGYRREPLPPRLRLLFRSTEQKMRGLMVVQILTIERIRNDANVLAMYILYLVQWSSEAKNLKAQDHSLVRQSGQGKEYSEDSDDCANGCHLDVESR